MSRHRLLIVALSAVASGLLFVGAGALASTSAKTSELRYFAKETSFSFTTPTGEPVGPNRPPAAGDLLSITDNLYVGTARHHAERWTASAALNCLVTSVSGAVAHADCVGSIAIDGSLLISLSRQELTPTGGLTTFPITGGAGAYLHARGMLRVEPIRDTANDNFIITLSH
jgi:hypothetical protein